ncbi:MAG: tetratricopeptide repeat protein [Deltaproteobacteria bacterium]|nr:tetratricopeptide repeat protein [Deltaproteobacteria bacterium]MCW5807559.1 tetratricopeptide repeat protein [Deltaproteobacteria bacterium]
MRDALRWTALSLALSAGAAGCGTPPKPPEKVVVRTDRAVDAKKLLAQAREDAKNGDVEAADRNYAEAYDVGKQLAILEERVQLLIHTSRAAKALEIAKAYYDTHLTDAKGYALYCDTLLAMGRIDQALDVAGSLLELVPQEGVGHEKKGRALILQEHFDEAVDELRKAVTIDSGNAAHHMWLGIALHKVPGRVHEAVLELRSSVKLDDNTMANTHLGAALRDQDSFDESKAFLDRALELDPRNGRAYFEMGLLFNKQQKQADAELALSKAVQLAPNESLYWYAYGEIYRLQERIDEALSAYRKAVDLDPPYPKAVTKLALLFVDRKQYDEAEHLLLSATKRDPKTASNYLTLGVVYAAKRKTKLAIEHYEKFLELAPKNDPDRKRAKDAITQLKRQG